MPKSGKITVTLALILFVSASIFRHLIWSDPILARDDQNILSHLHGFSALQDLFTRGHLNEIVSYQPVRDASFFADLGIQKYFHLSTFHFTNFLIWAGVILCVYSLLKKIYQESALALEMTALFAFHPIFVGSVGWISARKHLLSCLFIFLASDVLISFQKIGRKKSTTILAVVIFYSLSIFSQPINVLWPIWALVYCFSIPKPGRREGLIAIPLSTLPILLIGALANLNYYLFSYPIHTSTAKWASIGSDIGIPFLAIGRYFFNLLIPIKLALIYYPGNFTNILGLTLFVLFLTYLAWKIDFRKWFPWFIFFIFPLLAVLIIPTNIFVSDTYILVGSFGILNLVILSVGSIWKRSRVLYVGIILAFLILSVKLSAYWESDRALWTSSYATEASPRSLVFNAKYLIEDGRYEEATSEALLLESWNPGEEELPLLLGKSIYLNQRLTDEQKIGFLESRKGKPWIDYYLASLYAKKGRFSESSDLIQSALKNKKVFETDLPVVCAEARFFCLRANAQSGNRDCDSFLAEMKYSENWNQKLFSDRFSELMAH